MTRPTVATQATMLRRQKQQTATTARTATLSGALTAYRSASVVDLRGAHLFDLPLNGSNRVVFSTATLQKGTYLVQLVRNDGKNEAVKWFKN